MKKLEIKVINTKDVITTSAVWSDCHEALFDDLLDYQYGGLMANIHGDKYSNTEYFNYMNGVGRTETDGKIFEVGKYYCFDENSLAWSSYGGRSFAVEYSNWKQCDNPNHHHGD